ncbi:MAG: 4-hydroxybenzoate 3-monooxygenase [Actinomycetota bacterium]
MNATRSGDDMEDELTSRTQVGIVGAGPAGLVLGHLLHLAGIESVILEARSRDYVEHRVRAGVLEQRTADLLIEMGVGERLKRERIVHQGIELRFDGRGHRIPFDELAAGSGITIYGQQEVVKDLIAARVDSGESVLFEVEDVAVAALDSDRPRIRFAHGGEEHELRCDFIAGCDGFHGPCRGSVPSGALTFHTFDYPFGWLGILARVAPSTEELIYAYNDRGFALHSLRSPELSRLYVQCDPHDDLKEWPDERVWHELHARLARDDGWALEEGPIIEKGIAPMRSFVAEPMQYGRLYLAGDAVHIVPATGAKGLNLAVADVRVLADALKAHYRHGDDSGLRVYSRTCLPRVWRTQHFAWWMTAMLHRFPDDQDGFHAKLQRAQLEYVCTSRAAATTLAENYVGLDEIPDPSEEGLAPA